MDIDEKETAMKVTIQTRGFTLTPAIGSRVHERVNSSFARYAQDIVGVDVFLKDVNGPKGGEDKQAGIRLHIRHLAPVTVTSTDADLYCAIDITMRRAARSAKRAISRFRRIRRRCLDQLVMADA